MTTHILLSLAGWCAIGQIVMLASGVLRLGLRLPAEAVARVTRP